MDTPPQNPETADPRRVEMILGQVDALPTLSPVATRLLSVASRDDADLDEIATIIESDPPLSARVLGLCRKADRGLGDAIGTVRRAVVMLGLEAVQSAVLSVAVYEVLEQAGRGSNGRAERPADEQGGKAGSTDRADEPWHPERREAFDRPGFWKHSIAVACACELICERTPGVGVRPEEAFVAGLLHDLGRLALDLILPRTYARVIGLAERRRCRAAEVERSLIGLDHHTAGKRLAEHWGLPHALQDVMWLHSQPVSSVPELPHKRLIGVVTAARALCRTLHIGWDGDFDAPDGGTACAEVGLDAAVVEGVAPRLHECVAHRCRVLGIDDRSAPHLLLEAVAGANRRLAQLNGMLEGRARTARRQTRVLSAIASFHDAAQPGWSVVDVLAEVVRSAAGLLGAGFFGVVHQGREWEEWQLYQFAPDGRVLRSAVVEPPRTGSGPQSLARLADPTQVSLGAVALLPWLGEHVSDVVDIRRVNLLSLAAGAADRRGEAGPAVVLLHDRDLSELSADRTTLLALVATWGAAIAAANQHDGARRLGERLAASNRSLAETQSRLAEAQSLARLGEMAAGAAHEMNNPLTVISGRSQLLAEKLTAPGDRAAAAAIAEAAQHLSDLITSLHLISDPPAPLLEPTPIGEVVRAAVARAEERTGVKGRVEFRDAESATRVASVDRELMALALSEVIANGIEAAPDGMVEVGAQTDPLDDRLLIVVRDRGAGMSPRALQHAFDPFFSDKPAGRQTGLGLTRARRLVELHDGEIRLASTPGSGTTATISIPRRAREGRRAPDGKGVGRAA